jgi:hypothetical protein
LTLLFTEVSEQPNPITHNNTAEDSASIDEGLRRSALLEAQPIEDSLSDSSVEITSGMCFFTFHNGYAL